MQETGFYPSMDERNPWSEDISMQLFWAHHGSRWNCTKKVCKQTSLSPWRMCFFFHTYCSPAALPASLGIIDGKVIRKRKPGGEITILVFLYRGDSSAFMRRYGRAASFIGTARRLRCQPAGTGTADAPLSPAVPRGWIIGGALLSHKEIPSGCHSRGVKKPTACRFFF